MVALAKQPNHVPRWTNSTPPPPTTRPVLPDQKPDVGLERPIPSIDKVRSAIQGLQSDILHAATAHGDEVSPRTRAQSIADAFSHAVSQLYPSFKAGSPSDSPTEVMGSVVKFLRPIRTHTNPADHAKAGNPDQQVNRAVTNQQIGALRAAAQFCDTICRAPEEHLKTPEMGIQVLGCVKSLAAASGDFSGLLLQRGLSAPSHFARHVSEAIHAAQNTAQALVGPGAGTTSANFVIEVQRHAAQVVQGVKDQSLSVALEILDAVVNNAVAGSVNLPRRSEQGRHVPDYGELRTTGNRSVLDEFRPAVAALQSKMKDDQKFCEVVRAIRAGARSAGLADPVATPENLGAELIELGYQLREHSRSRGGVGIHPL